MDSNAIFAMFDKNGDGTIDASELEAVLKVAGINPSGNFVEKVKSRSDANSDGKLTKDEFVKTFAMFQEIQKFVTFFNSTDQNKSGTLSFAEMQSKHMAYYATYQGTDVEQYVFSKEKLDEIFDHWDGDKEQEMSLEEFLNIVYSHWFY